MREWARELLDSMTGICEVLDHGDPLRPYSNALAVQAAKLKVPIAECYPLTRAYKAHERLAEGHVIGKIVLAVHD